MTLLLAHPTPIIGEGLRSSLQTRLPVDVQVVPDLSSLVQEAASGRAQVALVDESLTRYGAAEIAADLDELGVPMLLLTSARDDLLDLLVGGVRGVVDPRDGIDGVVSAVEAVLDGLTHLPPRLLSTVLLELIVARRVHDSPVAAGARAVRTERTASARSRSTATIDLSRRERQVLDLLCAGGDQIDIAGELWIAPSTAKTHIARMMAKLGARTRVEAVQIALRSGLVDPEETTA